ncbi:MAG: alpha/beta fold hydrolase [Pseudomonadota bacterium]
MDARERRFNLAGVELAALEWPGEGLPVIALHGWLDNAASFVPLASELPGVRLLAPDLPGHGHSAHLPAAAQYHLSDSCRWVVALADAMGWQRFVLLGHSMGTGSATLTAAALPQRVAGLVLLDGIGPLAFSPEQSLEHLRRVFEAPRQRRAPRPFRSIDSAVKARQRLGRFPISAEAARLIAERGMAPVAGGYRWSHDERLSSPSTHYFSAEQAEAILGAIEAPALLLNADDGALSQWQGFARRKAALKGVKAVTLSGRHHLHMETPATVAAQILAFLTSLEERECSC